MMRNGNFADRPVGDASKREVVAICFQQFAPYHVDRISAAQELIGDNLRVFGIEYSDRSTTYAWDRADSFGFERITLFPSGNWEKIRPVRRLRALMSCLLRIKAKHVFLINYHFFDTFMAAVLLRLLGKSPYIMMASKYSDKDRLVWKELTKKWFFLPYVGGLASGMSHYKYLEFLGVNMRNFRIGLDTLSIDRVRSCSGAAPAPDGHDYERRHFTIIARMVPEKDIPTALFAYARYRDLCRDNGVAPRDLVLCGDGPERSSIENIIRERDIPSVTLLGFANEREVCETLATSLSLVLPSISEPWGLVVNEALAVGVPILCSNVCGAADELVQSGVNGFSFAPGEVEGLANLMLLLSTDEAEWRRLSLGALRVAPRGDVARFADAVASVIQPRTRLQLFRPAPEAPALAGARGSREPAAVERACALQVAGE